MQTHIIVYYMNVVIPALHNEDTHKKITDIIQIEIRIHWGKKCIHSMKCSTLLLALLLRMVRTTIIPFWYIFLNLKVITMNYYCFGIDPNALDY